MKPIAIRCIRLGMIGVLLAVAVGSGCQLKQLSYEGTIATQQDNIALKQGGPHEGRWEDSNIIVNHTYSNQAGAFEFSGDVELARRLTNTFRTVNNFAVRANFMDEEKNILKSIVIVHAANQPIRMWRFTQNFDKAPEVRSMNFSYSGRAMEGGTLGRGGDGADTFFWRVP